MGALGYDALGTGERPRLLEVLGRMPFGQTLFSDLEKRGELRKARADVLAGLAARFEVAPDPVRRAVDGTEDLELLSVWHRAVIRAATAADAKRAVLDGHSRSR